MKNLKFKKKFVNLDTRNSELLTCLIILIIKKYRQIDKQKADFKGLLTIFFLKKFRDVRSK